MMISSAGLNALFQVDLAQGSAIGCDAYHD
jgi:hypothetical protein